MLMYHLQRAKTAFPLASYATYPFEYIFLIFRFWQNSVFFLFSLLFAIRKKNVQHYKPCDGSLIFSVKQTRYTVRSMCLILRKIHCMLIFWYVKY